MVPRSQRFKTSTPPAGVAAKKGAGALTGGRGYAEQRSFEETEAPGRPGGRLSEAKTECGPGRPWWLQRREGGRWPKLKRFWKKKKKKKRFWKLEAVGWLRAVELCEERRESSKDVNEWREGPGGQ